MTRPRRGSQARELPNLVPDPNPDGSRGRFDDDAGIVYYNEWHPDYILVKDDESSLLDYLAPPWWPRSTSTTTRVLLPRSLPEEMVRMLVRVRRHMPRHR